MKERNAVMLKNLWRCCSLVYPMFKEGERVNAKRIGTKKETVLIRKGSDVAYISAEWLTFDEGAE